MWHASFIWRMGAGLLDRGTRLKRFKPTELTTRFSQAPYTGTRTSDVRIFNGILHQKSCNISVGYKVKCTYSL